VGVKEVCDDIKHLFMKICDYLLLNDPLQDKCARLIKTVGEFETRFSNEFRESRVPRVDVKLSKNENKGKDKEDLNANNRKDNKDK
jgi:hypothetical protein